MTATRLTNPMIRTSDQFHDDVNKLLEEGLFQEALDLARQGIRRFPGDRPLALLEAMSLGSLGHYPLARDILEGLRRVEPDAGGILSELTEVYLNLGKKKNAIRCAREALRLADCDEEDPLRFAEMFDAHGLPAEVARCSALAIRMNPRSAEGWFRLGCAVWSSGHTTAAESCCRRAVNLMPEFWIAVTMLAVICFDERRFEEAKVLWERVPMEEHQDSASLVRWRSLLRSSDSQVKEIRRRWREIRAEERPRPPHPLLR